MTRRTGNDFDDSIKESRHRAVSSASLSKYVDGKLKSSVEENQLNNCTNYSNSSSAFENVRWPIVRILFGRCKPLSCDFFSHKRCTPKDSVHLRAWHAVCFVAIYPHPPERFKESDGSVRVFKLVVVVVLYSLTTNNPWPIMPSVLYYIFHYMSLWRCLRRKLVYNLYGHFLIFKNPPFVQEEMTIPWIKPLSTSDWFLHILVNHPHYQWITNFIVTVSADCLKCKDGVLSH